MTLSEEYLEKMNKQLDEHLKAIVDMVALHTWVLIEDDKGEYCKDCMGKDECPEGKLYMELSEQIAREITQRLYLMCADEVRNRMSPEILDELQKHLEESRPDIKALMLQLEQDEKFKEALNRRERESRGIYQ